MTRVRESAGTALDGVGPARHRVSFVVIAFNEEAGIVGCLDAIAALDGLGDHEVIVVDDGSRDRTAALVRDVAGNRPTVTLLSQPNSGRGAARATGLARVTGDLVAMVDGDICLPRDWLACCLPELDTADVVGGTPVPDGDVAYLHRRFRLEPLPAPASTTVTGSNGLYRAEIFATAHFDPALRDGEDIAFNHLLRAQGWRSRTVPGLLVVHDEHKSFLESLHWLYQSGQGASRQLVRYRQIRPPDIAYGGLLLAAAAAARIGRSRHRGAAALPVAYLAAVSARHLASKFELRHEPAYVARFVGAIGTNAMLLTSYFAGRTSWMLRSIGRR